MERSREVASALSRCFAEIYYQCHPSYTFSLSHQAVRALQALQHQPGMTVSEMAKQLACAQNTASEVVQRLAEKGLLVKQRKGDDERTVVLSLTELGQQALLEQTGLDLACLETCLRRLSPEEQTLILSGFSLLAERLKGQG